MKKILAGLVAVTLVGSTALPTATSAEARWGYRGGWGYGGWGLGLGAVAAGAPIGGACSGAHPRRNVIREARGVMVRGSE